MLGTAFKTCGTQNEGEISTASMHNHAVVKSIWWLKTMYEAI